MPTLIALTVIRFYENELLETEMKKLILLSVIFFSASAAALTVDEANKYSDDYGPELRAATIAAVDSKICTLAGMNEEGGWTRSTKYAKTWFTYCGVKNDMPMPVNRVYFTSGSGFWNESCRDTKVTLKSIEIDGKPLTYTAASCMKVRK